MPSNLIELVRKSLVLKLILSLGATLFLSMAVWSYANIEINKRTMLESMIAGADRVSSTIKLGTHYAMMLNARGDIAQIIANTASQPYIEGIRIYNKAGEIKFSGDPAEIDQTRDLKDEACVVCHRTEPPQATLPLSERVRVYTGPDGVRRLGIMSPIGNEPGCSEGGCHFHPADKKILGLLDVVISLADADAKVMALGARLVGIGFFAFVATCLTAFLFVILVVRRPVGAMIRATRRIAAGEAFTPVDVAHADELGELGAAINTMGREIARKQAELNRQRDEYQQLFDQVPCIITVQDKGFRLLQYNREFAERFHPMPGDFCYRAYKGRDEKCEFCPVEKTFQTGRSTCSEESGFDRDGTPRHWLVTTSPVRNEQGDVVAAMEMCLDITQRKALEEKLAQSEKTYHAIFNNIPSAVLVVDPKSLEVLDVNVGARDIYGYGRDQLLGRPVTNLFREAERDHYAVKLREAEVINLATNVTRDGQLIYVTIHISPTQYEGRNVLLVTTSDITKRLETEQQLIQASKMATLGEMATGVAHELNQPLSVIKTAAGYLLRKIRKGQGVPEDTLASMADEIDGQVDRAAKIINHMREFGRKSDLRLEDVCVNDVVRRAFDIFGQQLKLREIEVVWDLEPNLPRIPAEASRLEQVFINLLINARDAIEERWGGIRTEPGDKRILLHSHVEECRVVVKVSDTGVGIRKEIIDKLFEPFFTTKEVGRGTGLGLSISYGIVHDYGGEIKAESEPGRGATFVISFPVYSDAAACAAGQSKG